MKHLTWHQPFQHRGRFANSHNEPSKSVVLPSIGMYLASLSTNRTAGRAALTTWHHEGMRTRWHDTPHQITTTDQARPRITWIGHASFLFEYEGFRILLDPVFHHLTFLFHRHQDPGIMRESLPTIDAVLISHNHLDHLEQSTVQHLSRTWNSSILVPAGDGRWMKRWGVTRWEELTWWESRNWTTPNGTTITATFVPAHHWSQRGLFDRNRSLWGGWVITINNESCYFAGDTAYSSHFHAIAERFSTIDLALLPIGPCEPRRWMRLSHINAEEAGQAFLDLKARRCVPMHWGTFGFGTDQPMAPLHRLESWWHREQAPVTPEQLCILRTGETLW